VWLVVLIKLLVPPTLHSPVSAGRLVPEKTIAAERVSAPEGGAVVTIAFLAWLASTAGIAALSLHRYRRVRNSWLLCSDAAIAPAVVETAQSVAHRLGLRRVPEVRMVRGASGPAVVGFGRPIVVLPETFIDAAAPEQIEHVLLHEMAHVKRRDPLSSLVCQLVQMAYWFHPVVWLVRRRLTTLREVCCDRTVAGVLGTAAPAYRRTLLELARPHVQSGPMGGLAFMHRHSQIISRLSWLERPVSGARGLQSTATALLFLALLVFAVPLAPRTILLPPVFKTPPLSELNGCLEIRYAVMKAYAEQQQNPPTSKNTS
jgi:beta-lactamase regulating signal transducer with metallopeptidase domain